MDTGERRFQLIERPVMPEPGEERDDGRAKIRINREKFDQLLRRRGFVNSKGPHRGKTHQGMFERATAISNKVAWKWMREPGRVEYVSFDVLARICDVLQCAPGDILEFVPASDVKEYRRPAARPAPVNYIGDEAPDDWE